MVPNHRHPCPQRIVQRRALVQNKRSGELLDVNGKRHEIQVGHCARKLTQSGRAQAREIRTEFRYQFLNSDQLGGLVHHATFEQIAFKDGR